MGNTYSAGMVLITYPNGKPCVAETKQWVDGLWVRGHGDMQQLIEQQGCTITPLVAMTPELVEALSYVLFCLSYHEPEDAPDNSRLRQADALLRQMLNEQEAGQDDTE